MKYLVKNKKGLQLSNMILGMLLTIAVITGFSLWIADGVTQYSSSPPSGYNTSFARITEESTNLGKQLTNASKQLDTINSETQGNRVLDFLSFFFDAGYRAAQIAVLSIGSMNTFVDVAISETPLGEFGNLLKILAYAALLAVFIIGILLNFIIKSGRE